VSNILVTGGAGYIGSHTCISLLEQGHSVLIADNLCNSSVGAIDAIRSVTRSVDSNSLEFAQVELADPNAVSKLFDNHAIEAVVHFAGLKAVGESVEQPLAYYGNNLRSTLNLLEAMAAHEVYDFVFSSSATVYGDPEELPITEGAKTDPTNPYGRTKLMVEDICQDLAASDHRWRIALLRYFNPVGAHPSGDLGENPSGIPNNLVPYVMQVAVQRRDKLQVFGDDWGTPDGTGVRDYIHVLDLAAGHLAALDHLTEGAHVYNLGTGNGASVLEVINTTQSVSGQPIPYDVVPRRAGDIATSLADPTKANHTLDWRADRSLETMLTDAWRWQSRHPMGFKEHTG